MHGTGSSRTPDQCRLSAPAPLVRLPQVRRRVQDVNGVLVAMFDGTCSRPSLSRRVRTIWLSRRGEYDA